MKRLLILVGCLVVLSGLGIWFFLTGGLFGKRIKHVILISIDTCRADRLGCYGYRYARTPNIDAFAEDSTLFENVVSTVPLTLPAHSSMMTGTIPPYHGVHDNLGYQLGESNITLAEILKEKGYATGAVIAAFVLDSRFGLDQGFDYYNDRFDEEYNTIGIAERKGGEVTGYGIKWLAEHYKEPFFLFLHYYDPHQKYDPPEPFKVTLFDDDNSRYNGEIAYADHCVGQVIEKLKTLGIYDSTLIIITGDHGEALGGHLEMSHGYFIYQETMQIPLMFKVPGISGQLKVDDLSGVVDIMPTICSILNIDYPSGIQGKDLSQYCKRKITTKKDRHLYCESMTPTKSNCSSLLGVVNSRFKYIQAPRPELYDLVNDPHENNNLVEEQPQRARMMQDRLKKILEETVRKEGPDRIEFGEEERRKLEALGYIASSRVTEDFDFDQTKDDPKDFIFFHNTSASLACLVFEKKYSEAKEICLKLLEQRPDWAVGYNHMYIIYNSEGKTDEAIEYLKKGLALKPNRPDMYNNMGLALLKQEKYEESLQYFCQAKEINPGISDVHNNIGVALTNMKRYDEALISFYKVLELQPEHIAAYNNLADLFYRKKDFDSALENWKKSLSIEPEQPVICNNLAALFEEINKTDQASMYYQKSLVVDPNQPKVYNTLGRAEMSRGKLDQAVAYFSESLRLEPRQNIVLNNIAEVFMRQGKNKQALDYWQKALEVKPDMVSALNNMAWLKAVYEKEDFYNPAEAVQLAERAVEVTEHKEPGLLDTLSIAYAAADRFDEAVEIAEEALEKARSSEQDELAREITKHLQLYKLGQPYRQKP